MHYIPLARIYLRYLVQKSMVHALQGLLNSSDILSYVMFRSVPSGNTQTYALPSVFNLHRDACLVSCTNLTLEQASLLLQSLQLVVTQEKVAIKRKYGGLRFNRTCKNIDLIQGKSLTVYIVPKPNIFQPPKNHWEGVIKSHTEAHLNITMRTQWKIVQQCDVKDFKYPIHICIFSIFNIYL